MVFTSHVRERFLTAVAAAMLVSLPAAAALYPSRPPAAHSGQHGPAPRQQGYLGIEFHDLSDEEASQLHMRGPQGAEVVLVDHDGPAGKAGLRPHDIITALNGQIIDSSAALRRMIHEAGANVSVALSVFRGGKTLTINAKLADREAVEREAQRRLRAMEDLPPDPVWDVPAASPLPVPPATRPEKTQGFIGSMLHILPFTGLELGPLEPQLGEYFGAPKGTGLLVHGVTPDSPASRAGLHAGDIVLRADNVALRNVNDWTHHLHATRGKPLALIILRDRHEQTLTLTPDLKHKSSVLAPGVFPHAEILTA